MRVADIERYIEKVEKERDITVKGVFWVEYQAQILDLRRKASRNCETYDDVKIYQGEIKAYDKVFNLPEKIVSIIEEKEEKRATK